MPRNSHSLVLVLALTGALWLAHPQTSAAQWVVLHDQNTIVARDLPKEAADKLSELAKTRVTLKSISFTPNNGWAILHDKHGYVTRNIPQPAFDKLQTVAKQGATLKSITFSPGGGWVILHDKQGVAAEKIPDEALKKLNELAAKGADLTSIAFTSAGGWVVLFDQNGLFARNIPDEAFQKLNDLAKQGAYLKSVTFSPDGGWLILHEKNGIFARKIPDELYKQLVELDRRGATLNYVGFLGRPYLQLSRDDAETREKILARLTHHKVPGVSIVLIQDGQLKWARGFGVVRHGEAKTITETIRFQAASISKPVTALAALRLAQEHKLELDQDVNLQLRSWKVPDNEFTKQKHPTIRQILSHTAGFNVHGFPGYASGDPLPSLLKILDGTNPANTPAIRVIAAPGTRFQYSGGGYSVLQQLLVDITKTPFPKLMQEQVLGPLGMKHSTYAQPFPKEWQAAAGLWTTPSDLARFLLTVSRAQQHQTDAIIEPSLADAMFTRQLGVYGLGIVLRGQGRSLSFSHGGYRCIFVAFPATGQGAVLMTNSDNGDRINMEFLDNLRTEYAWPE